MLRVWRSGFVFVLLNRGSCFGVSFFFFISFVFFLVIVFFLGRILVVGDIGSIYSFRRGDR